VPPSGTTRGRIGTGGGGLYLTNPGTDLGDGVEAQLNAATGTSTNKFGIYDWADTTQIGYLKFKIRTTSTGNGNLAIAVGKNTIITDNNGYTSQYNNSLTVFWITYTSGNISAVTRRSSGSNQSITNHEFSKDTNQNVEIYFNNSNTQVSYKRNNTTYNLNAQTWDLWIDDNKKSTDGGWPNAGTLANTEKISGFAFFAENSTGNAAWLYIDDIEYSNELPTDAPAQPNKPNITFPVATDTSHDTNSAIIIVSGTATAGDTIHLYIGPEEKSTITNITSTNWSFTIGIDTGLKINDTTIIKIAASNNTGIYSDTAQITIFVDTAAPVMIGSQLVTGNTEFLELRPTIQFAQFIDSSTITHYEIYYDTDTNFSNYQYSVSSTNSFTPSADLTYDTWYFRVSAVDKFNQKSDSAAFIAEILITPPAATKPTILKPTIRPNFVLLFPAVKIQGYADAGDTILLYSNDILISSKPAASDTFWSFIIDTSAALIINDTVRIKIYAINTEGRTSLPAELDIFVYQPLTRTENFSNLPTSSSSSYLSRTWNGVGGQWTAEGARTDQTLNGKAICFGNSGTRKVTSPQFNDGISYLSFLYSRAFTATTARTLEIYINNELIDTIAVSPTSNDVQTYTKNLNINGAVKIEIQSTGLSQVKLDDITWNANYDPRPAKPIITAPISNTDTYYTNSNNFILTGAAQTNYKIYLYQNSEYISNTVADNNTFQFNITGIPDAPPSKIELILENEYNEESDTTILNIIIDKIPPVLTADRLLTKTKYNSQQPMITFNTFTDNNTIAYYKIYLDTNINFTNYIYETAPTTTYIPTMNLTYDTWYIKIRAVDIAGNESADYTDTFITKETVLQPIADIKNVDNNGIPLYLGDEVIVEGIVTLGTNRISRANNQVFIQDHSAAGICLFKANDTSYVFTEGDSVRVRGIVGNYNGLTTIEFTQVELLAINQSLPEPLDITTNQLATTGEIFEGKRIKITNAKITSGSFPSSGINANLTINDGTGNAAWRIEGVSDISGKLTPGCSITVVGIVSQYVTSSPFTSGHQLVLRSYDDIVFETNVLPQYYNSALSKRGEELLRSLNQIIRGHKKISYDSLWRAYYFTDVRAENKVWDIYSDYGFGEGGAYNYTLGIDQDTGQPAPGEGYSYNREHTFSQNWFNNLDNIDIYSDIFHIYPTDKYVNNKRGHLPMGKVDNATETFTNGSKIGPNVYPGYDGSVFEIIDAYKGDIARTYFYIVARYLGEDTGWNNTPMFDGSKIKDWAKKLLIEWHTLDPVSEKEINRNNEIYKIQGNRNPFIDYPDFVYAIWGYGYDTAAHNVNNETTIIADSFQMIIPANIVTDTNYLNLKIMDFYNFPNSPENHFQLTDKLYSVTFENYDTKLLSKNVEIKIYYDESKLPFAANENEITVFWYNADNDSYVKLDTQYYSINTTNNLVTINVNYVGLFGVFIKEKIVPIINIKTVNNSGVALHLNKKVTVEGIATVSSGIYHATQNKVFIQDTTAAVMIYQSTQSTNIPEGAKVRVTGTISQYYGLLQLENPQITIIDTGNVQPEPIILTLSELSANGELYEGQLVKIERVKIVSGQFPTQPNYWQNLTINDGTDNFTLRIESTNPDIWDKPTPTKEFNVIGIVNQYDGSSPYTSGYQLIPRYYADFEFTLSQGIYSITTATETSITIGGYELYIPANTVSKPTFQIKIEKLFALPAMTQELKIVNPVYHIITDSSIGNLNENIRQIIGYDTSLLPYGADENILKLYKYDINSDTFILIDSNLYQINTAQKKIIISSDTFEIYAIFAEYPMTNIREIRQIDNNGTPLLIGKSVMIEGIVTHITGS
ncbi:MAG TPA: endonuclease, partial [bacterium]|nr:endonuclease [bacterium]